MSRFIYFIYYIKVTDWQKFFLYLKFIQANKRIKTFSLIKDIIKSSIKYNISFLDYFYFRFYEQTDHYMRSKWAGTGFMYEYQLLMNPKNTREILQNKILFLNNYKLFTKRLFFSIDEIEKDKFKTKHLLNNPSGKIVLKYSRGQVGREVEVINTRDCSYENLLNYMKKNGYDLAEEFVIQHPSLNMLSPSGLNTVRIITQINNGKVFILGARLRITVNSHVDNLGAGNIAAPVDVNTGTVIGPAVYSDITKQDVFFHPVTRVKIINFKIPYWSEVISLTKKAALYIPANRSVGWDVAITKDGPELIEGNHNWCKLLWQLPVKKGLKQELEKFI